MISASPSRLSLLSALILVTCALLAWPAEAGGQSQPRQAIDRALSAEPSVDQVQQAALRASGYDADDLDQWSSRARWSHLLPEVRGEVAWLDQRDREARYQEDMQTDQAGKMFRDGARNHFVDDNRLRTLYAVDLEWDLSGLVYDRSESTIAREVRQRRKARRILLEEVSEAYYMRRRHLVELMLTPRDQWRKRIELQLEVDRYSAHVDAMTAGWFSRTLAEARKEQTR
ncbi:MAG: hypothetical protein ACLFVJ_20965 [Persicimonas sp.]